MLDRTLTTPNVVLLYRSQIAKEKK